MTARLIFTCETCGGEADELFPMSRHLPGGWLRVVYPERQVLDFCCEVCLTNWAMRHAAVAVRRPIREERGEC